VRHAAAGIDEKVGVEIGFLFVLLDVVAVGLAEDAPVNVANLVAGVILAMLGELDTEALVGTFMHAAQEAGDDVARNEAQPAVFGEGRGIEEYGWRVGGSNIARFLGGARGVGPGPAINGGLNDLRRRLFLRQRDRAEQPF